MEALPPVPMPVWMVAAALLAAVLVLGWLVYVVLAARRDLSLEDAGRVPMPVGQRQQWSERLGSISSRWEAGEVDLRGLHLELAALVRGFAQARCGREVTTASVTEILDMAEVMVPAPDAGTRQPASERLRRARQEGRPRDTNPLAYVGELLAVWEQPSFDREPDAAAREALEQAEWVVSHW